MTGGSRLALALNALALLFGCHASPIGPPPNAPELVRPLDAMPADLDLVLRLDLRKIRETLGGPAMTAISREALRSLHGADSATDAMMLQAFAGTDTLWLGVRPRRGLEVADGVWVMSGHFPDFNPHRAGSTPPFEPALDLGGDLRRFDRARPEGRSAPARCYARGQDLIVCLSEAEIDSVERSLEDHRGAPPLEPAEKGAVSAILRPRAVPVELLAGSGTLQELAQRAERLEFNADLTGAGVDANVALKFDESVSAERVSQALTELRDALRGGSGRLAKFATRVAVSNAGQYVTLQLTLGRDELAELVNCRGSACAW
jgi:hypothetical protein